MKGTLLNTATVAGGAVLGLIVGRYVPATYGDVAIHGLGLVTCGIGVRMFLKLHNPLVPAIAVAVGGVLGLALGIQTGIEALSEWARLELGGEAGRFNEALITTFVIFCVGPMTVLGCLKDGLEGDIEILALKSTLDGVGAFFFAAALGPGVLVTAVLLFVFQGVLTLLAKPLKGLARALWLLDELTAAGGAMLLGIGLHLIGLVDLKMANYLPALFLAPAVALFFRRIDRAKVDS